MLKIIVGREPESRQLKLKCGKTTKLMGNPGSVPNSVSREHVAITVDEDADRYFIENLKPANEVLVNGISVMRREVGLGDMINLGGDRYPVRVSDIVGSFVKEKVDISSGFISLWTIPKKFKYLIPSAILRTILAAVFSEISGFFSINDNISPPAQYSVTKYIDFLSSK